MPDRIRKVTRSDKKLRTFVLEVTSTLLAGERHRTPGLGTFSTCTRKASAGRKPCKMAMFRASAELREYAGGGRAPAFSGPHADVICAIVEAMFCEHGIEVPGIGRLAVVPVSGKNPKLIFHGADSLNKRLTESEQMLPTQRSKAGK